MLIVEKKIEAFIVNLKERWSQKFGPLVKMDQLMGKMIQNDKEKEPFA